jgi:epoxyqueuosine reductase
MRQAIIERALALGFDAIGFADARATLPATERLASFLAQGYHGDMGWMEDHADRRAHPNALWPEARSAIVLGLNYGPDHDPLEALADKSTAVISVYAQGSDYHDLIKKRLKSLGRALVAETGCALKVFVDTAPLMEKPLAERGGLGWQGKHTNLVSREFGSWLFLGVILTDLELQPDPVVADHCGSCQACLDICPTKAFPGPYQLDARRCISYLTIEYKGHIAPEFRVAMGNRIYGCDDCLAACPWNKFAKVSRETAFRPKNSSTLSALLTLDDAAFRAQFAGSPIKRIGRDRFIRNVLIAAGNSGLTSLVPLVEPLLTDQSPLVRAMAVWAMIALQPQLAQDKKPSLLINESDEAVRAEWARI